MEGRRETGDEPVRANQREQLDWDSMNWNHVRRRVEKMQQEIFRDTRAGNFKKVTQKQKLLVRSLPARLWVVKLVTEVNKGRNTPGIDGSLYRTGREKVDLVESLKFKNYKPYPVKIKWIPKPGGDRRKLGIPTIRDRTMQMLILLVMNPEWEAKFEPHSFGFRPGRNAIDAVHHIVNTLRHFKGRKPHPGWILDADISKCFDNINHEALLKKIEGSPFQGTIRAWLKSGAVSRIGFENTSKGTPQGGIISPLLANIALDGMERQFGIYTRNGKYYAPSQRRGQDKDVAVFRYADDFIVLAPSRETLVSYVIPKVESFLTPVGLNLNDAKTRVVNVSEGFEFLGFTFRRFYRRNGAIKCFTCFPSRRRLDRFLTKLKGFARIYRNRNVKDFIKELNRRITGFCNYFKWSDAHKAFAYLSFRIWDLMWRWAKHRHPKRSSKWLHDHYWKTVGKSKWVFSYQDTLLVQPWTLTAQWWKWPKVRLHTSPFDREIFGYWQERRERRKTKR